MVTTALLTYCCIHWRIHVALVSLYCSLIYILLQLPCGILVWQLSPLDQEVDCLRFVRAFLRREVRLGENPVYLDILGVKQLILVHHLAGAGKNGAGKNGH